MTWVVQPAAVRTDGTHVDDVLAHDGAQPGAGRRGGDEPAQVLPRERQHLAQVLAAGDLEAVVAGDVVGDQHGPVRGERTMNMDRRGRRGEVSREMAATETSCSLRHHPGTG